MIFLTKRSRPVDVKNGHTLGLTPSQVRVRSPQSKAKSENREFSRDFSCLQIQLVGSDFSCLEQILAVSGNILVVSCYGRVLGCNFLET